MDSMKPPELKRIGRLSGRNVPYPPPAGAPCRAGATCKCTHSCIPSSTSTIPDRIVEAAAQAGAVWQCQWPTPRPSRPAIRDRISAGIVLHFLTAGPSPSLLFLSPFFASKYLLWPRSSSVECVEVWGSGWCAVQKADLEPVQLGGNQLYQDEFLCPEALAGQ